jgi:uncharacterized protein (TIGR03437 family)
MNHQRTILIGKIVAVLSVVPILIYAHAAGPDPGKSGVPGESTCAESGCHTGAGLNLGGGSVRIDAGGATYTPGVKQRISVTVTDPTQRKWGFQLTARLAGNSKTRAGLLTAADGTTQVLCAGANTLEVPCNANPVLQYIEHTLSGSRVTAVGAGETFQFDWTPPATDVGPIVLYAAGNAANGNATETGDNIYTTTLTLVSAIAGPASLVVSPKSLFFNYQVGGAVPAIQSVSVNSTSSPLTFTVSTTSAWLAANTVNPLTPGNIGVSVNPVGLSSGTYSASLTILSPSSGSGPQIVTVLLTVSPAPNLLVSPTALSFAYRQGDPLPSSRTFAVTSNSSLVSFAVLATVPWITVSQSSVTAPASVTVSVNPVSLSSGTYSANLTITSPTATGGPQIVTVSLTVSPAPSLIVSPTSLSFAYRQGSPLPPSQTVTVTSNSSPISFGMFASGPWITVSQLNATAPTTINVSMNPANLTPGTYTGAIIITTVGAGTSPQIIPVTLSVVGQPSLSIVPNALVFTYRQRGIAPEAQSILISSTGSELNFQLSAFSAGNWLAANARVGKTPAVVRISVDPSGLAVGKYTGLVVITALAGMGETQTLEITLLVGAESDPIVTAVVNAASYLAGAIAPGEVIIVLGSGIGPSNPTGLEVGSDGVVATLLSETRVLFDDGPAPLIYVSENQVRAVSPYQITGQSTTQIQIEYRGKRSNAVTNLVSDVSPGIFTLLATGTGQGAILNEDGSANSDKNPATRGSIIALYATGVGQTDSRGSEGTTDTGILPKPKGPISVRIQGVEAELIDAGFASSAVTGILQIRVRVPDTVESSGTAEIVLSIAGVTSQPGVSVAVR